MLSTGARRRRFHHLIPWLLAALLCGFGEVSPAQDAQEEGDAEPFHAGEPGRFQVDAEGGLRRRLTPLGMVTYLSGPVTLTRPDLTVLSERARYYEQFGHYWVVGNVHAIGDSVELWADSVRVEETTNLGYAYGHVKVLTEDGILGTGERSVYAREDGWMSLAGKARIIDGKTTVNGDSLHFDQQSNLVEAFDNVKVVDGAAETVVTGAHGVFDREAGVAWVDSLPELIHRSGGGNTSTVKSDWMRFEQEGRTNRAVGNVRFRQGTTIAHADTAEFIGEDVLVLTGSPQVEQDSQLMSGDEIRFTYEEGDLRLIEVFGTASLVDSSPDTLASRFTGIPLANELTGDSLRIEIDAGDIARTRVSGGASSIYLPEDQETTIAVNEVKGDEIDIRFTDGQVDVVNVQGNVIGNYRFLELRHLIPGGLADSLAAADPEAIAAALDSLEARSADEQDAGSSSLDDVVDQLRAAAGSGVDPADVGATGAGVAGSDSLLAAAADAERRIDAQRLLALLPDSLAAAIPVGLTEQLADSLGQIRVSDLVSLLPDSLAAALPQDLVAAYADTVVFSGGLVNFNGVAQRVDYDGDAAIFAVKDGRIHIAGEAQVKHGTLTLASDDVFFDTDERELLAEGDPLLVDSGTELVGEKMGYLFDYETGAVSDGGTRYDDGFYYGDHVRRMSDESLLVADGAFTTCDLADPHYHFRAKRMKLQMGEKVVARQVTFVIDDLPLITLPFYFKSLDSGRHSGIIFPNINIGVSSREGRYIRDFGYYWATNEFTDFRLVGSYNERNDFGFGVYNRYVRRYSFTGNASFTWKSNFSQNLRGIEWRIYGNHSQPELFDAWRLAASYDFSSNNLSRYDLTSGTDQDLRPSQLRSNLSLSRSFVAGSSLSLSAQRTQSVGTEDADPTTNNELYRQTAPQVGLNFKTRPLMSKSRRGGGLVRSILSDMNFSQGYRGDFFQERRENSSADRLAVGGSYGLNFAPSGLISVFKFTSSASFGAAYDKDRVYSETWEAFPDSVETAPGVFEPTTRYERVAVNDDTTETFNPNLSFNNSLRTDLYGIFDTRVGPLRGLKHKLTWSMGWSYRPELGENQMRSQSMNFRLGNELSVKYAVTKEGVDLGAEHFTLNGQAPPDSLGDRGSQGDANDRGVRGDMYFPEDEGADDGSARLENDPGPTLLEQDQEEVRKLDRFLSWDLGVSYNPEAPKTKNWGNISSLIRLNPGFTRAFDFAVTQSIDPYTFDFVSTSINTNLRVGGEFRLGGELYNEPDLQNIMVDRVSVTAADTSLISAESDLSTQQWREFGVGGGTGLPRLEPTGDRNVIPWSISTRATITHGGEAGTRATIGISATTALPGSWKLDYRSNFDVERGQFTNQFFTLRRILHCWTLEFNRSVTDGSDFGFRIYLTGLPDLELTRGDRALGNYLGRLGQQ